MLAEARIFPWTVLFPGHLASAIAFASAWLPLAVCLWLFSTSRSYASVPSMTASLTLIGAIAATDSERGVSYQNFGSESLQTAVDSCYGQRATGVKTAASGMERPTAVEGAIFARCIPQSHRARCVVPSGTGVRRRDGEEVPRRALRHRTQKPPCCATSRRLKKVRNTTPRQQLLEVHVSMNSLRRSELEGSMTK